MKKQLFYRALFYILGLLILAMGLTLNTKAGLGVSPIISVSYSVSEIFQLNFGNTTLVLYCLLVAAELVLHALPRGKGGQKPQARVLWMDVLQIPLSLVFTRFLNLFGAALPDLVSAGAGWAERFPLRLLVLAHRLVGVGIGTVLAVIGVGRVIALFHRLAGTKLAALSGLAD